jgi:chromosome segregation ATPase
MAVVMKKIVLENFKSFEGSVEIDIAPFTSPSPTHKIEGRLCCVIGPNGSGMCIATSTFSSFCVHKY